MYDTNNLGVFLGEDEEGELKWNALKGKEREKDESRKGHKITLSNNMRDSIFTHCHLYIMVCSLRG